MIFQCHYIVVLCIIFCRYVGRPPSCAVATGNKAAHIKEEKELLFHSFNL